MPPVPRGVKALSALFLFGAAIAGLASLALLFPGGALEPVWQLNPAARTHLASLGTVGAGLIATVSIACAAAALGLRSLAGWGHKLALALLGVSLAGDAVNAMSGHYLRALLGMAFAGLLIAYLLQLHMRALFAWRGPIPRGQLR
jgi:hypothetical protein